MKIRHLFPVLLTVAAFSGGHLCFAQTGDTFPYVGIVNSKDVNVRAGQSRNFARLGQLKQGDEVVVTGKSYSWLQIRLPHHFDVYIHQDFLEDIGQNIGKVTANRVNVRSSGALENSVVLGQARKGELVRIKEKKDGWYRIEPILDSHGWVSEELVNFRSAQLPPPAKIEAPVRSMLKKAEEPAPEPPPPSAVSVAGIVQLLDEAVSADVRHKIIGPDNTVYYLEGYRRIIDGFLNQKVRIEGTEQKHRKSRHPVILVRKIELIL